MVHPICPHFPIAYPAPTKAMEHYDNATLILSHVTALLHPLKRALEDRDEELYDTVSLGQCLCEELRRRMKALYQCYDSEAEDLAPNMNQPF